MKQQHLVVHGEIEHAVIQLFAEAWNPSVDGFHELRDGGDRLVDLEPIAVVHAERRGENDGDHDGIRQVDAAAAAPTTSISSRRNASTGAPSGVSREIS